MRTVASARRFKVSDDTLTLGLEGVSKADFPISPSADLRNAPRIDGERRFGPDPTKAPPRWSRLAAGRGQAARLAVLGGWSLPGRLASPAAAVSWYERGDEARPCIGLYRAYKP